MRPVAALAAAGLLSTGLVVAQAGTADAAAGPLIRVFIGNHSHVHMTDQMRPGVHKFVVRSHKQVAFQLVQARRGYTKADAARDVNAGLNNGNVPAIKRFERNITLLGGVSAGPNHPGVAYLDVPRGHVWALDTNPAVTQAKKIDTFTARGSRVSGNARATYILRTVGEHTWANRPLSIPRAGVLRFANRSTDNHFIAMARLLPGKTIADFKAWANAIKNGGNPGPPPIDENVGMDSAVVSPGHAMAFHYSLPRGRYVLTCFWPDAGMGGIPHAFLGMSRELNVR
jgi:hypothetical protein